MKRTLTALTLAASMFANGASAFNPDDLQKLKDTNSCVQCNLQGANLQGVNLQDANLQDADLRGATLWDANLQDVDLSSAVLRDARLIGAIMNGVILCNTTMPDGSVIYSGC